MLPTIAWVALPLGAYAAYAGISAWRKRAPSQRTLNIHTSLLLMAYLLTTAGLGIFWVANQQLPVFDLHYLFGYATLLLVALHLGFNLPVAWRTLRAPAKKAQKETDKSAKRAERKRARTRKTIAGWLTALALVAGSFFLGMRHGRSDMRMSWSGEHAAGGHVDAVVKYHEYASHSRGSVFARAPGIAWGERPPPFKTMSSEVVVALPPPNPNAGAIGPFSAQALSNLMHYSAGITLRRGGLALRASPSSGALFPTELYLVVREAEGVAPGVYHYDPREHRLEQLSTAVPDSATLGAPNDALDETPATVIVSSIFRRTGFKYRDRAYRYAIADAGHLLENLRVAGQTAGYWARPLLRFDERLVEQQLGVDGVEEAVVALISIETARVPATEPLGSPPSPSAEGGLGVTGMVQLATSLRLAEQRAEPAGLIALPQASPTLPALSTIAKRRSQRRYNDEPVTVRDLTTLLVAMALPPMLSRAVRINLVANRVSDLPKGVYRYHPLSNGLELRREGDQQSAAHSAGLSQDVIGDAAVVFILSVDRAQMFGDDGARGYRHAFLEAGMVGERLLLSAIMRGLGACSVGAFYDDEAAKLVNVSPDDEWVLHFVGVGQPQ
jgi:SagB-type dehydrogenase family enzyme